MSLSFATDRGTAVPLHMRTAVMQVCALLLKVYSMHHQDYSVSLFV